MASNPPFEPQYRLPPQLVRLLRWRWWPWNWFRDRPRLVRGTLVLSTADGMLHVAGFSAFGSTSPRTSLSVLINRSFASSGAGAENWTLPVVRLSGDEQLMLVDEIETVVDAIDFRVSLFATATGAALFSVTDNSLPDVAFSGDAADAPPDLAAAQAAEDVYWREDLIDNPATPRRIITGVFFEEPGRSTISAAFTIDRRLLITGACPLQLSTGGITDPVAWWGIAESTAGARWAYSDKQVGTPPASILVAPAPARARDMRLGDPAGLPGGRALLLDGVVQTAVALAPGTVSFDGPFTA